MMEKGIHIYYLACISAVILWSGSFITTKLAYETFAPIQLGAGRTLIAALIIWIIRKITNSTEKIRNKDRKRLFLSGLLGITLYFTLENIGVQMTSASNAALIVASFPAITALLEFFLYRSKPSLQKILGIFLAITGVAILTQIKVDGSNQSFWGNLILLGAGIVWACYNFVTKDITRKYSAMTITSYQMTVGTLCFIPFLLWEDEAWKMPNVISITSLLFLSIGCSVAAFILYNYGLKKLSASASVSLMNLVPVLGIVFSVFLLKEIVTLSQVIGGAIVIIGVILSSIQKEELPQPQPSEASVE
ncbi:DMT family transporter [Niallia circulans]|uniref:DMT family transporter n=1 Tax=Niallia circulans TaxID=1397 RepID=UPI0015616832|nr:DMT family transporter [Niallia circulans]NRG30978.1 DMT family transporter [Niallia circulans]